MALTPEQIAAARAKYGVPAKGYGMAATAPTGGSGGTSSLKARLSDAWSGAAPAAEKPAELPASGFEGLKRDVGEDFKRRDAIVKENKGKVARGEMSEASGLFSAMGQAAGMIGDVGFDVFKSIFKPEVRKKVDDYTQAVAKKIIETPVVADQIKLYGSFKENHPELASNLESALNIVSVIPMAKGVAVGAKVGEKALETGVKVAKVVETGAEDTLKANKGAFIKDLVTPEQTKAVKIDQVGRTTETGKGPFKKSVIEPSAQEAKAAEHVANVPNIDEKATLQQNYNHIKTENKAEAIRLEEQVKANDFAYPRKELLSRLNAAKEELARNPVITGDAEKTAEKLIAEITRRINATPAKGSNLLKVRKEFDQWLENQKGGNVFDPAKESALSVSNRQIRQTINTFLDEKAPNAGVRDSLRKQTALYDAMDNIAPKAAKEADSAMGRFFQKMDSVLGTKNKAVQILAATVGIGGLGAASAFAPAVAAGGIGGYLLYKAGKLVLSPKARKAISGVIKELGKTKAAKGAAKVTGGVAGGATASTAAELVDELNLFLTEYGDDESDDSESD